MEQVILVDEMDRPIGSMEKMEAHEKGLLHRAFSIFIFNEQKEMLLQQRADEKYHSAGLWTNACCSHPRPGEETISAANRRLVEEMGFNVPVIKAFDFVYKASFDNGLIEYEFDHVFTGVFAGKIVPNKAEVKDFAYLSLEEIEKSIASNPEQYTAWFRIAFPRVCTWLRRQTD